MKINCCKLLLALIICVTQLKAQTWQALNPPLNVFNNTINTLTRDADGNIYAAGKFKNTANEFVVVKWNGSNWTELGNASTALHANGDILCLTTDPNGNIYAAGAFTNTLGRMYIAKWNGTTWSQLGTGTGAFYPNGLVYAMTLDRTGNLYVAGGFTDNNSNRYIAKWNGSNWAQLGTGANAMNANGDIYTVTADSTSNIYAGGHFTNSNSKYYVAKWNGTNWTESGAASPLNADDYINCVKADKSGNIYAAGGFKNSSGDYYVAQCNGNSWSETGSGTTALHANGAINSLAINDAGNVYAAGYNSDPYGNSNVVCWNGSSWNEVFYVPTVTAQEYIKSILIDNTGNVYAAGSFINISRQNFVAKWDGVATKEVGRQGDFLPAEFGQIKLITTDKWGKVYAVGGFWSGSSIDDVGMWDGVGWVELKNSNTLNVKNAKTITTDTSGNVYIAGDFKNLNGQYFVAKWDGSNWVEVSAGTADLHSTKPIFSIAVDSNNNIYAAGEFIINGGALYGMAKWNGSTWNVVGNASATGGYVAIGPGGTVYTAGGNNVMKWDGITWSQLGTGANALNANSWFNTLITDRSGNVYVAGNFTNSSFNAYVAKWDGTKWSELGTIPDCGYINSLATDANGNIYAAVASDHNSYFYVAKWDGTAWTELGGKYNLNADAQIYSLCVDNWGTVYAAGSFNWSPIRYVAYYGNLVLKLQQPILSAIPDQLCNTNNANPVKILNLPDNRISTIAKLDNVQVTIGADSSFYINAAMLTTGTHRISVSYILGNSSTLTTKDFQVVTAVSPNVDVSSNITDVTSMNPVIITATNASGGGTAPLFTFAKDRNLATILQAESANNKFNLDPATLAIGNNWIYVRMRTNESCYTAATNIDSINITRSATTDIRDIDYPNQEIYATPIPFNESFAIKGLQISKSYSITLINSTGQIILSKNIQHSQTANMQQFVPAGIYWLSIFDNSKKRSLGVIKLIKK